MLATVLDMYESARDKRISLCDSVTILYFLARKCFLISKIFSYIYFIFYFLIIIYFLNIKTLFFCNSMYCGKRIP